MKITHKTIARSLSILQVAPAILAIAASVLAPDLATAATNDILNQSCSKLYTIRRWAFNITYILGGIGLVLIAIGAFFGRFKVSQLIGLGGGLFIVGVADYVIAFATDGTGSSNCDSY